MDFSLPVRPFMNQYSDGLSGSKKFVLLVAHFAKGELDVPVDRAEVIDTWNKMTGLSEESSTERMKPAQRMQAGSMFLKLGRWRF